MKSLSLERPLILIMLGHPGSGKSYFSRQFADLFKAPLVSYDTTHYQIFAQPTFSRDEEAIVGSIINEQIKELAKTGKTFVVDGNFGTKVSRMEIEKVARANDYGTLVIWVQTDIATAKMRALRRNPKRDGDRYNAPMTDEQFEKAIHRVNPPTNLEPHIVISGKHNFASQAKVILKKLVAPRDAFLHAPERSQRSAKSSSSILIR